MTTAERIEAAKPYIKGFVGGLVAAPIVGFGLGWVVLTGTMEQAVAGAKIEQLAAVCAGNATAYWTSENRDLAALRGYQNREERGKLVLQFATTLPGIEAVQKAVVRRCDDLLRT